MTILSRHDADKVKVFASYRETQRIYRGASAVTFFKTFVRSAALAAVFVGAPTSLSPVIAAPADVALIKSYIGEWRGRGTLYGATTESVVCRLTMSQGNGDKVNYNGRCTLAGTTMSLAGTVAFNEQTRRYEAALTTNATFHATAIGQKRGRNLIFNLREREQDEKGKDLNISAQIQLTGESIGIVFEAIYIESGDSLRAEVPLTRN